MPRIMAKIQYDGTAYCGFQIQPNGITVQEVLQAALARLLGENIKVVASGRTDAGVHAAAQVIHFDAAKEFDFSKLPLALSSILPNDISVLSAAVVDNDFHARYSCIAKTYEYVVVRSRVRLPIYNNRAYVCEYALDIAKIREAMQYICGEKDYKAFMASGSSVKDTVRNITSFEVKEVGDELRFTITANGFLYNMVRNIIGTLIDVGRGRISPLSVEQIILGKDRTKAGITAPAHGLYLISAQY